MKQGNVLRIIVMLTIFLAVNAGQSTADVSGEYDPNTEVNLSGIMIKELNRARGPRIFLFESNNRVYHLISGPQWYLWKIGLFLKEGSRIEITGSKIVDREGNLFLLLYDLRMKDTAECYKFRDRNMKPLWRGRGQERGNVRKKVRYK
jgi:hypothetical protein